MISLIKRDILKNTKYKYMFYIIMIYIFYLIFQKFVLPEFLKEPLNLFSRTLGISYNTIHFLDILIIILTNLFYSYNSLNILLNDLRCGKEQILLRTGKRTYVITKLASISITTIIMNTITYLILCFVMFIIGVNIYSLELLNIFIIDTILKIIFECFIAGIYSYFGITLSNLCLFITPLAALLKLDIFKLLFAHNNNHVFMSLLTLIIIILCTYIVLRFKIKDLFEKEERNEN